MPTTPPVIFWFRRDLRLTDNLGLHEASLTNQPILAVFVLEPHLLKISAFGVSFCTRASLPYIKICKVTGCGLHLLHGSVEVALPRLIEQTGATALFYNKDYTPYATQRDQRIQARIGVPAYSFDDAIYSTARQRPHRRWTTLYRLHPIQEQMA
ncbi:MAG UNVERIFIED_CONTAM: deoxyribodipyrimidine photo-lyase [Anaerolineae bacterium]|jgi:deoxyribodipyrimidine photo-lyase